MNRSLWISATGMQSQEILTETIANNMANVNTHGYKRSVAHFQDLLYQMKISPGSATATAETPMGIQQGTGVATIAVTKSFTQGGLKNSSSSLDVAIEGSGFFMVQLPDGTTAYTRAGNFTLSPTGQVVTPNGYPVLSFPTIDPQATNIDIADDGTVSVTVNGVTSQVGRIQLARFANPEGLRALGRNLYADTDASGTAVIGNPGENGNGKIAQYFLEASNVEIITEMVDMIAAQRAYELLSKGIKAADDMMRIASNLKT